MVDMHTVARIEQMLDPQMVAEKAANPNWMARESFPLTANKADGYQQLLEILIKYSQHHMRAVGFGEAPDHMALGKVSEALRTQGLSLKDVYDDCRRGTNGGVRRVLDMIAAFFEKEMVRAYIDHVIASEIDEFNYDEVEGLVTVLVNKYGKHLPYQLKSVPALIADWKEILLETVSSLSSLRSHLGKI